MLPRLPRGTEGRAVVRLGDGGREVLEHFSGAVVKDASEAPRRGVEDGGFGGHGHLQRHDAGEGGPHRVPELGRPEERQLYALGGDQEVLGPLLQTVWRNG